MLGHAGDLDAAAQLQLAPLPPRLRLAQCLLEARCLAIEAADRLAHLLEQGARLQVTFAALAHLRLDFLLALGDPLCQHLDLCLALVEGRLRGLAIQLTLLLAGGENVLGVLAQLLARLGLNLGAGVGHEFGQALLGELRFSGFRPGD